ncbi:MAG: MerR family transcriptional regulator [Acidimicrobiales bacterium]
MSDADSDDGLSLRAVAAHSGIPVRTIRYYQSQGVLPKPEHKGRDAVYRRSHLDRLRLIAELQDRGLTLTAIADLVKRPASPGSSVDDWLGLDETLRGPWSEDRPMVVDEDGLTELVGPRPAGFRGRLETAGMIERRSDGLLWQIPSPRLLELALQLHGAGIDVEVAGQATDLLRRRLSRAVDDLIVLFTGSAGGGFAGGASADELATALAALRPIARETAGIILAQEVERGLRTLLDADPTALRSRRRTGNRGRRRER